MKKDKKVSVKSIKTINTANFAIKKSVLKEIGYTNLDMFRGNDTELSIRLQKKNKKIKFIKGVPVKHLNKENLREIFKKYYESGFWHIKITKIHKDFLKKTDFLKDTCQTPWAFFKFFPGVAITLINYNFKIAYYEFIRGLAWRLGLIKGLIKN